jgi:radical SAM superfamily enzyme YgiQ (UPF0313 family)
MREKYTENLLREEYGSLYRQDGNLKAVVIFPNSYYLGMSSLGFQTIVSEFNRHPDLSCERAFFFEDSGKPAVRSFETQKPIREFDIIGFSISFELDYINLVKMLHLSGLSVRSEDRKTGDPLIIAGGICPSFNPEPVADFIDAFVIGDGEEAIHELISEYQLWRQTQNSRQNLFYRLSEIKGVYVPLLYDVAYREDGAISSIRQHSGVKRETKRRDLDDLDKFDTASKILTPNTEFARSYLVEIARGCIHRCKFCIASYIRSCRMRSKDAVLRLAQRELSEKADKIGLLGSSVTDHPQIDDIATSLVNMGRKISLASVRADLVSESLLDALAASEQDTITLAPEAASERLRSSIGKDISLEMVFQVIKSALKRGISNVKLYFMVGLPTEEQEDIYNIVNMVEDVKKIMFDSFDRCSSRIPRLSVSISPFVPKPHTPFQWCQMEDSKILSQKLQLLRRELGKIGGIRFPTSSARLSSIQGAISRGDRRLGNVLYYMSEKRVSWKQALKINRLSQDFYIKRIRSLDEVLPWKHLNLGVSEAQLKKQFLNQLAVNNYD